MQLVDSTSRKPEQTGLDRSHPHSPLILTLCLLFTHYTVLSDPICTSDPSSRTSLTMKLDLLALAALSGSAQAHYIFSRLVINGKDTRDFEYVRDVTRNEKYMPTKWKKSFGTLPSDTDFRCNQGSFSAAGRTKVAEVAPGSTLSMILAYGATMKHPGPGQVYMSKAPGSVTSYAGDGDWFKIHQETVCGSQADGLKDEDWCTWDKDRLTFKIPADTPPGEYLIRPEHIGLHVAHEGEVRHDPKLTVCK
jgi:hypothetical protein